MRKFYTILVVILATGIASNAQTSIPGGSVSGTWTLSGSPYNVQGSIMIPNASTLIIEPGVTVNFESNYQLQVNGSLQAVGTETDSIIFTGANTTLGWQGIRFPNTSTTNDSSRFKYCRLQYGYATGSSSLANGGAFCFTKFSNAIISNCLIKNCSANYSGGGICCDDSSNIIISNNNILYNRSDLNGTGGGVYDYGGAGIFCRNSSPLITGNTIAYNKGYAMGSGIFCWKSNPIISNNIIINNDYWVVCRGGGIACLGSSPIIINNTISNNSAIDGGGLYFVYNSNPIVSNNTITNNVVIPTNSNAHGGAMLLDTSSPIFTNNTIANNKANYGGVMYCSGNSNPVFNNCIIWGDTAVNLGSKVFLLDEGSDPAFNYCDIQGGQSGFELNGNFYTGAYQNNINSNPLFVAPSAGCGDTFNGTYADWSLQSASPCINTGNPTGTYPTTDKAGNPRVMGGTIDIGAYEFLGSVGIMALAKQNTNMKVYPNPTVNQITVEYKLPAGDNTGQLMLFDMTGKIHREYTVDNTFSNILIATSSLPVGTYYYTIKTKSSLIKGQKIIKIE